MHRREPDYDNARYWFRRVGAHPIFGPLRDAAAELAGGGELPPTAAFLRSQGAWDPFAFVGLCQAAAGREPLETLCRRIQRREWDLLFEWCYRQAKGQDEPATRWRGVRAPYRMIALPPYSA